jgi:hypothetical protein
MVMLHVPVTGTGTELIVKVINFICYLLEIKNERKKIIPGYLPFDLQIHES